MSLWLCPRCGGPNGVVNTTIFQCGCAENATEANLTSDQVAQAEQNAAHENYPQKVLVALDQDVNVDAGGLPDETISSRVRRISDAHRRWGWNPGVWLAKALNAGLNLIQRDHGQKAQAGDLARAERVAKTEQEALSEPTDCGNRI